ITHILQRESTGKYSPELVAGPGAVEDPNEVTVQGCDCQESACVPPTCTCLPFGDNYIRRAVADVQRPVLECNIMCKCSDSCANRETQTGLQFHLRVCGTPGKGWGVTAMEDIPRGRFVCEYAGEVLHREEACSRTRSLDRLAVNNYIIAVREHLHNGKVLQTIVDPTRIGNVGRFLNHSCQPNLFMLPVRTHSMVVPRLALFAARDISAGEELCYDYSGRSFNSAPDSASGPGKPTSRKRCLCGTPPCSGYLPFDDWLCQPETRQEHGSSCMDLHDPSASPCVS
uniref:SET domain and mariner transposase fusion gene n=1 Tax=Leptobrachium leishanense TaxID=445787 RepID=A0A8C5R6M0_9ANUR